MSTSTGTGGKLSLNSTLTQASGYPIPVLGFGVYQTPAATAKSVVLHALNQAGYRHIDSARAYRNEGPCAAAIQASGIPREQIFFTSKIPPKALGYEKAKEAIAATFAEEGSEALNGYVDLYLIHAPYGGREGRLGAWKALVEAQHEGKIRSIGVSNYGVHHLDELAEFIAKSDDNPLVKGSKIDVNQVELHPWLPRQDIVDWCKEHGVVVEAYCPVVRGKRADEPVLKKIAEKHSRTWAQVLVRWSLQKGYVPLPKSETPSRIEENARVFDFELDEQDMAALHFPDSYAPVAWDPTVAKLDE